MAALTGRPLLFRLPALAATRSTMPKKPIAIYYEHQNWFKPLFAELERRGTPAVHIDAGQHRFDPGDLNGEAHYGLVFNRTSPSAYNRGKQQTIFYTQNYLAHLESKA